MQQREQALQPPRLRGPGGSARRRVSLVGSGSDGGSAVESRSVAVAARARLRLARLPLCGRTDGLKGSATTDVACSECNLPASLQWTRPDKILRYVLTVAGRSLRLLLLNCRIFKLRSSDPNKRVQIRNRSGLSLVAWARRPVPWPGVVAPSAPARPAPLQPPPSLSRAMRPASYCGADGDGCRPFAAPARHAVVPPELPLQPCPACSPRAPTIRDADSPDTHAMYTN